MHIGLNLIYLVPGETGGMEVYARELIPELVKAAPDLRFTAFINEEAAAVTDGPWGNLVPAVVVPVKARNRIEWVRGEQLLLPPAATRAGVDLLHSLGSTAPAWGHFRRVVTIHDLNYRMVADAHLGLRGLGMRVLVPLAARRADRIIADSQSTASDVIAYLKAPAAKVDVVPLGLGSTARRAAPEIDVRAELALGERRVLLSVSAKRPSKNLSRLLDAFASIPPEMRPVLVLPGYPTPYEDVLRDHARDLGIADDVRFLGWIPSDLLEGLYAIAECFVFPSLYEGFGLPVLEAMARGVPVACSARGSLAEVAADAALTFDPTSTTSIGEALRRILDDTALASRLREAGREQAARFSWSATAVQTAACYRKAAGA